MATCSSRPLARRHAGTETNQELRDEEPAENIYSFFYFIFIFTKYAARATMGFAFFDRRDSSS